jgi:hypothetical protein
MSQSLSDARMRCRCSTVDVATLLHVIDRLRRIFAIHRVCVVADRGMISAATIAGLERPGSTDTKHPH